MISVAIIINHSVSKEIDNLAGNYFILMKISRPILTKKNTASATFPVSWEKKMYSRFGKTRSLGNFGTISKMINYKGVLNFIVLWVKITFVDESAMTHACSNISL